MKKGENKELQKQVMEIFRDLGILSNLKGYTYLLDAITLCMEDSTLINKLTTELYPTIANKYGILSSSVVRVITISIKKVWKNGNKELISSIFGSSISEAKRPSNIEFIATIIEYLRPKEEKENQISTMLRNLGIPCHLTGYKYLLSSITLCMEDSTLINNIYESYHIIVNKYDTTYQSIEHAIRNSIKVAWKNGNKELISSIFGSSTFETKAPSNLEFIAIIVEYMRPKDEQENQIFTMLRNLGIPCHLIGYKYLLSSIRLYMDNYTFFHYIMKELNYTIADMYNTTYQNVEQTIRKPIKAAWQNGNQELISSIFGSINSCPTSLQFIETIAEYLQPKSDKENQISNFLKNLGVPSYLKGYKYLQSVMLLCMEEYNRIYNINTELYPYIAKIYDVSAITVNNTIKETIELGWQVGNQEVITSIFGFRNSCPTSSEFIATIIEYLRTKNDEENQISTMLCKLGAPCNYIGYRYLISAILLCMKDYNIIKNVNTRLYSTIAEEYGTTPEKVDFLISQLIQIVWLKGNKDLISSIFGDLVFRPSNSEFISGIVDELSLQ